jgi:hypothetical protein
MRDNDLVDRHPVAINGDGELRRLLDVEKYLTPLRKDRSNRDGCEPVHTSEKYRVP